MYNVGCNLLHLWEIFRLTEGCTGLLILNWYFLGHSTEYYVIPIQPLVMWMLLLFFILVYVISCLDKYPFLFLQYQNGQKGIWHWSLFLPVSPRDLTIRESVPCTLRKKIYNSLIGSCQHPLHCLYKMSRILKSELKNTFNGKHI